MKIGQRMIIKSMVVIKIAPAEMGHGELNLKKDEIVISSFEPLGYKYYLVAKLEEE